MKVKFFGLLVCMILAALVGCGSDSEDRAGDCGDILRCWLACEDDTCAAACDDGYPAAVVSAWNEDVRWCVFDGNESCDYELSCLKDICAAELEACSQASSSDQ